MQQNQPLTFIQSAYLANQKLLAVLVDPDKNGVENWEFLAHQAANHAIDFFLVGGSLLTNANLDWCVRTLKTSGKPVLLFPGNTFQISTQADGLLFLSLISGRNPEMLIGRHVIAAPYLKAAGIPTLSTGYMLIESGKSTSVSYMSNTTPIPSDKNDIAICTALAGQMLGLSLIYMDAGSGASQSIPLPMIRQVSSAIEVPLIIGGGIRSALGAQQAWSHGATVVVVGNKVEESPEFLNELLAIQR